MVDTPSIHKKDIGQIAFDFNDQTITQVNHSFGHRSKSNLLQRPKNRNVQLLINMLSLDFDICAHEDKFMEYRNPVQTDVYEDFFGTSEKFEGPEVNIVRLRSGIIGGKFKKSDSEQAKFDFMDQPFALPKLEAGHQSKANLLTKPKNINVENLINHLSLDLDISAIDEEPEAYENLDQDDFDESTFCTFERIVWSDADIDKLRTGFFDENIRLLCDGRTSQETRQENYEWLMSDEKHAFSFLILCREEMLSPDRIREGVQKIMRERGYLN